MIFSQQDKVFTCLSCIPVLCQATCLPTQITMALCARFAKKKLQSCMVAKLHEINPATLHPCHFYNNPATLHPCHFYNNPATYAPLPLLQQPCQPKPNDHSQQADEIVGGDVEHTQ